MEPNIPKNISSEAVLVIVKPRLRNRCSGSIGSGARASQATNAATSSAPMTMGGSTVALVHPWSLPQAPPRPLPSRPRRARGRPGRSSLVAGPWLSASLARAIGSSATPIGTFSQKIHCQDAPSTTAPPTSGPMATARPPIAPHAPRARPLRCGGTAADSRVRVSGIRIAAPTPCTARAATSHPMLGASAAAADPAVNRPRPPVKSRRRPYRSPSVAPVSSSTANVRVYAFTVHCSPSSEACRWSRIDGSAVVTTRLSSDAMNRAVEVTAKVQMVRLRVLIVVSFSCSGRADAADVAGVAGAADDVPDATYWCGEDGEERGALGRGCFLQDEAEEREQGELGRAGHHVVAQGRPFLFCDVLGRERKKCGLLVVEVFEQDRPVVGQGRHEGVALVGSGCGLPRRDRGGQPGQRGRNALVLGLHAQDDVCLKIDPGQERRPQQLVLALVVVLQSQPVVAEVVGDHPGARGVARIDCRDEFRKQPRLAAEGAVDDLHVPCVDAHLVPALHLLDVLKTAPEGLEGTWS